MNRLLPIALCTLGLLLSQGSLQAQDAGQSGGDLSGPQSSDSRWEFSIAPYFWLANVNATVQMGELPLPVEADLGDLLNVVKFAASLHAEARKDRWGIFTDVTYFKLGTEVSVDRQLTGQTDADIDFDHFQGRLAGTYDVLPCDRQALDLVAGVRLVHQDSETAITGDVLNDDLAFSETWVDPIVGLRYWVRPGGPWMLNVNGDIGGFGVGSEFAWSAGGGVGYSVSRTVDLLLEYRAYDFDYDNGESGLDRYGFDGALYGLMIGALFRL